MLKSKTILNRYLKLLSKTLEKGFYFFLVYIFIKINKQSWQNSKIFFLQAVCRLSNIIFVKFQNDCSKNKEGGRF